MYWDFIHKYSIVIGKYLILTHYETNDGTDHVIRASLMRGDRRYLLFADIFSNMCTI